MTAMIWKELRENLKWAVLWMLADNPTLGRRCDDVRPDLRRMECGRHVVFYREDSGGILVSRILHQRMLPKRHDIDDDGTGDHE